MLNCADDRLPNCTTERLSKFILHTKKRQLLHGLHGWHKICLQYMTAAQLAKKFSAFMQSTTNYNTHKR